MPLNHHEAIRREFDRQAPSWVSTQITQPLQYVVDSLDLDAGLDVLDVAAGTGAFATALAPYVRSVTSVDLSPKMLELGALRAAQMGMDNVVFLGGCAEALAFTDESFDLVVTRYSIHHVVDPVGVLAEMARVARRQGLVVTVDMLAHDDPAIAARQNALERLVDSTHTRMLTMQEFMEAFGSAGLTVQKRFEVDVVVDFDCWQSHLDRDDPQISAVRRALLEELAGSDPTGFRPFLDGDSLNFHHTWGVLCARKVRKI